MSKPSRSKRKELDHYKLMQRTEKQVEARLKKEMNRFKDKDQFELEDHIIDLENKIKELNETIKQYEQHFGPADNFQTGQTVDFENTGLSWYEPEPTGYTPQQSSNTYGGFTQPIRAETRPTYEFIGAPMPPPIPQENIRGLYETEYGTTSSQLDVRTPAEPTVRVRR